MARAKYKGIRGLDLNRDLPEVGFARSLRNMHLEAGGRAVLRKGWRRLFSTASSMRNSISFRNQAGTLKHVYQVTDSLKSFDPSDPTFVRADLLTGMDGLRASFAPGNGYLFVADNQVKNYIGDGATFKELHAVTANGTLAPTETGASAAVGFGTGRYGVCYSLYNPTLDMETPPSTVEYVTKANGATGIKVTTPADPSGGYTTIRFYRTRVAEEKMYFAGSGTVFASTFQYIVLDITLGSPSFAQSKLHNDDGAIVAAKPPAALYACSHKSRMNLMAPSGYPLRVMWSDINRLTQYRTFDIGQAPAYHHDLIDGAGSKATGIASYDGSLQCFKDYSITLRNGDVDTGTFQWNVVVDGTGCIAPKSIQTAPGIGTFFMAADGIYLFNNSNIVKISDLADGSGIGEEYRRRSQASAATYWFGVWNGRTKEYLAFFGDSGTFSSSAYVYNAELECWSGPFDYSGKSMIGHGTCEISSKGVCVVLATSSASDSPVVLDETYQSDGNELATSLTGTVSTVTGNHLNVAATVTGYGFLTNLYVTVRHAAGSYESKLITGTGTNQIQVGSAWSSSPVGKTYYVGSITGTISMCRFDGDDSGYKELQRLSGEWKKQTHTTPVACGWTKNDDTEPTYAGHERTMGDVRFSIPATDRCVCFSPFLQIVGVECDFQLRSMEFDFSGYGTRGPSA